MNSLSTFLISRFISLRHLTILCLRVPSQATSLYARMLNLARNESRLCKASFLPPGRRRGTLSWRPVTTHVNGLWSNMLNMRWSTRDPILSATKSSSSVAHVVPELLDNADADPSDDLVRSYTASLTGSSSSKLRNVSCGVSEAASQPPLRWPPRSVAFLTSANFVASESTCRPSSFVVCTSFADTSTLARPSVAPTQRVSSMRALRFDQKYCLRRSKEVLGRGIGTPSSFKVALKPRSTKSSGSRSRCWIAIPK